MEVFYETVHTSDEVYVREHSSVESAEQAVEKAGHGYLSKYRHYKQDSVDWVRNPSYSKLVASWEFCEGKWYAIDIDHISKLRIGEERPSTSAYR